MASILARNVTALAKKSLAPQLTACVKHYSDKIPPYYDPAEGKTGMSLP